MKMEKKCWLLRNPDKVKHKTSIIFEKVEKNTEKIYITNFSYSCKFPPPSSPPATSERKVIKLFE